MASGKNLMTYVDGAWHNGDLPVLKAGDHGTWLGSSVFDGARCFDGVSPDLDAHCARLNASARAMLITPTHTVEQMVEIIRDGLCRYEGTPAVYIRPMYWALDGGQATVDPKPNATGFLVCLEEIPMPAPETTVTLGYTQFRRPVLESAVCNAKAGALYPNNARMLREVNSRGFGNALVADALGNVAETATSNVFMVRDGEVFTPAPNGTFLAGITRHRHIENLRADGVAVYEAVLSFADFEKADEVFVTGNMAKIMPVTEIEGRSYQVGPIARRARSLYWDWAHSAV